jgi:glc operon protein GlcG
VGDDYGTSDDMDPAHMMIMAAVTEATKHNWKMAISVVGPAGNLATFATMGARKNATIPIARAKVCTATLPRRPPDLCWTATNAGDYPSNVTLLVMNGAAASEGGFPIVIDGKLAGAVFMQAVMTAKAGLEAAEAK